MYHCVGCGANTPWDRESLFSYTCPCGGHIFAENATGELVLPESLGMVLMDRVLHDKRALPPPISTTCWESLSTPRLRRRRCL